MKRWILIAFLEGDATLSGTFDKKKDALFSISGNYFKSKLINGCKYDLIDQLGTTKYTLIRTEKIARFYGFGYLF